MGGKRKTEGFRLEIRIGIGIIILVLSILNVASYYTLSRVHRSLESETRESLAEAAVLTSGEIPIEGPDAVPDDVISRIRLEYNLARLEIYTLHYDRVLEISSSGLPDSGMAGFSMNFGNLEISPVLQNIPLYHHDRERQEYLLLFPTERYGTKYLVAVLRPAELLSAIANAMRILLIFGLVVGAIILYVLARLVRNVLRPYGAFAEEVRRANLDKNVDPDDINAVTASYEKLIEELKEKSRELREMNELVTLKADRLEIYNNHILRSIDTGLITIAKNGQISTVNKSAADILGIDQYDPIGKKGTDYFKDYDEFRRHISKGIEKGKSLQNHELNIHRGGGKRKILLTLSPLIDSNNENIGHVIILNDQTELEEMQRALENSRRMAAIGEMSSGLAHQLRNSIMAIIGFARLVEKKVEVESDLAQTAASLITESRQAEKLVARFLDYARPLHLSPEKINLNDLLIDLKESAASRLPGITLELPAEERVNLTLDCDPLLLKQALGNIVDNAGRAYEGQNGTIKIAVSEMDGTLQIGISDEAGGIPEEYHDQIFTPFFSGSPSGSGLGLPLAEKIVSLHNGTIRFESEIGKGTVFTIDLPLENAAKEKPQAAVERLKQ